MKQFGHAQRRPLGVPIRNVDRMVFSLMRRDRGRPKWTLGNVIKRDLGLNDISKSLIWDRKQ